MKEKESIFLFSRYLILQINVRSTLQMCVVFVLCYSAVRELKYFPESESVLVTKTEQLVFLKADKES